MKKVNKQRLVVRQEVVKSLATKLADDLRNVEGGRMHSFGFCQSAPDPWCNIATGNG